jgi:hypothetical protein
MAVYVANKGNQSIIRLTANATLNTVSNTTGGNCDISPSDNACRGAYLSKLLFSTGGNIKISRGANLVLTLVGSDHWDLEALRLRITDDSTGNINIAFSDTNSSLIMVVTKLYDGGQNPNINQPGS